MLFAQVHGKAQCPEWNDCFTVTSDGCNHTIVITITGDAAFTSTNISALNLNFGITSGSGTITNASFVDINGEMSTKGVSLNYSSGQNLNISYFSTVTPLDANFIIGNQIILTVIGTLMDNNDDCFTFSRTGTNSYISNFSNPQCMVTGACSSEIVCSTGTSIGGAVSVDPMLYDCQNTLNHAVQGVNLTVTSASDENCNSSTNASGNYGCEVCGDGPYTVCATTKCPEPCGLDNTDIVLLREYVQGLKSLTKNVMFTGDINNNGSITTLDLLIMQRNLLGLPTSDWVSNWCRFVPITDYLNAPDPYSVPNPNYSTIDNCITVSDPNTSISFYRFMVGDVNGTCSDCVHGDGIGGVGIVIDNNDVSKSIIKSPVSDKLSLFTFKIELADASAFLGITSPLPNVKYAVQGNILNVIWLDQSLNNEGYQIAYGQNLLEINFLNSTSYSIVPNQSYIVGQSLGTKEMSIVSAPRSITNVDTRIILIGIKTKIDVSSSAENIHVGIYDVTGRMISTQNLGQESSVIDIPTNLPLGIYYVRTFDGNKTQTKRVVLP